MIVPCPFSLWPIPPECSRGVGSTFCRSVFLYFFAEPQGFVSVGDHA
jgi:hypothetical protein